MALGTQIEGLGKIHRDYVFWGLKPYYLGTWTPRADFQRESGAVVWRSGFGDSIYPLCCSKPENASFHRPQKQPESTAW